ncbi:MAG TPA: 16S rRNA (guanine(966)-N(2))-methyltransferase RsmD [Steroidobacteraceae bacterium]|nr:16S rRNA (guanine(966)-N(2))-methyltransferase RsmD [Steroidobacteraceae bacterium]
MSAPQRGGQSRVLRIIGGAWRGRRLRFPAASAIRPTPDRVRETLFNWLGARIVGARCLDLFAGSGALGLEALSRGAAHVHFVERHTPAARELQRRLAEWQVVNAQVTRSDALRFLAASTERFDVAFLDPPFDSHELLEQAAERLERCERLTPHALIYVECPAREALPALPPAWRPLKAKRAGEVGYHLLGRLTESGYPP